MFRLKTRAQFQAALDGKIVSKTQHFALHRSMLTSQVDIGQERQTAKLLPFSTLNDIYIGAIVSKRLAKRAVTRNAIRRQIYCVSEALSGDLLFDVYIVRLRHSFERTVYASATSVALKQAIRCEVKNLFANVVLERNAEKQDA